MSETRASMAVQSAASGARSILGSTRKHWKLGLEVTSSDIGDAPMLPELLAQIPADQDIASVTADGAYDTRKCHDAIAERGAHAVIPPRKNAKP